MKRIIFIFFYLFHISNLKAILIGSDMAVLRQGYFNFTVDEVTPNEIRGFVKMENGFSLNNSAVTCEFNAFFPVKGDVSLNDGILNLSQDLLFDNVASFTNLGHIIASQPLQVSLASLMSSLGTATDTIYTFSNIKLIFNSNITLHSFVQFEGNCVIDGNKNILDLSDTASIMVGSNTTLKIKNIFLKGIQKTNVRCIDNSGVIILESVVWSQEDDVQFVNGALRIDDVKMNALKKSVFAYQSSLTSTILNDSILKLDSTITFSYDPIGGDNHLIELESATSCIEMDGATLHITLTGMQLTNGVVRIKRDSFIATEKIQQEKTLIDNGLTIGSGIAVDDTRLEISSGTVLAVNSGTLNYKNILNSSLIFASDRSILCMKSGTILRLFNTMDLGNGFLKMQSGTRLIRKNNSKVIGAILALGAIKYTEI